MPKSGSTPKITRRTALAGLSASAALLAMPRLGRAADESIRIGFPTPLTGPFAAEARDQVRCAELAVKLVNDKGGIGGRKVELLVRDDKLNAGEAATRTLELIEKDKVHAVVGALSSAVQLAVNEVTRARGVIYVSISQSDTINEAKDFSKYTFHEALNPHMTTAAVARQTLKKGMKVAHLVADYAYGHEMLRGFKRAQTTIGADTVGEILHPFGAADYSTFMPRLMSMRPDVLCISNFGRDQANAIKQAVDFGVKQQMKIVVPVILHNQRLAVGPDVFEGVVGGYAEQDGSQLQRGIQGRQRRRDPDRLRCLWLFWRRIVAGRHRGRRRHRHRQGRRCPGEAAVRSDQGAAALPQMRSSVGAVGAGAGVQEEVRDDQRQRSVRHSRQ